MLVCRAMNSEEKEAEEEVEVEEVEEEGRVDYEFTNLNSDPDME